MGRGVLEVLYATRDWDVVGKRILLSTLIQFVLELLLLLCFPLLHSIGFERGKRRGGSTRQEPLMQPSHSLIKNHFPLSIYMAKHLQTTNGLSVATPIPTPPVASSAPDTPPPPGPSHFPAM